MARYWLKPWRLLVLLAGWIVLPIGIWFVAGMSPPPLLHFEPPQPGVIAVQFEEARAELEAGRFDEALEQLEQLREKNPLNPMINAMLGEVHRRAGRIPEAIAATRVALSQDPDFGEAAYNLACDLIKVEQPDAALRSLRKAVLAGFDFRPVAAQDSDLSPLREDARLRSYLEGGESIPLKDRDVAIRFEPRTPRVGEHFAVILEVVALHLAREEILPEVSVAFLGPAVSKVLVPQRFLSETHTTEHDGDRSARWLFRYEFMARERLAAELGPWEIQLGGVQLALESPLLVVEPAPELALAGRDLAILPDVPALRTRTFFDRTSGGAPEDRKVERARLER